MPNRAPPLPEHVVYAMAGWGAFHGHYGFSLSLLVGFFGMLRTGELLACRRSHFRSSDQSRQVVLSLRLTKGGKRVGAAESVVLGHDTIVKPLIRWMKAVPQVTPLTPSPAKWRKLFNQAISALHLDSFNFRPYSLRRGGATWWFMRHHSLDWLLLQGRWHAVKTARTYLNEGLSVLAEMKLPANDPRIAPFIPVFHSKILKASAFTLEPPPKNGGRSGGRGNKGKKPKVRLFQKCLGITSLLNHGLKQRRGLAPSV